MGLPEGAWTVLRVFALAVAVYAYLVLVLRLTGNRTLAKLRAFDFIVTIAIGSLVASALAAGNPATALNAVAGATALVSLQWVVAYFSARNDAFNHLVTSPPRLLFYEGRYLEDALRKARVTRAELRLAMRRAGRAREEDVAAVILETNGDLTVMGHPGTGGEDTTRDVPDLPPGSTGGLEGF